MIVRLICGSPASGKGTYAKNNFPKLDVLNRDSSGGSIEGLLPKMESLLKAGKDLILDNTFPTIASRAKFIELSKKYKAKIDCIWLDCPAEEASINAIYRMIERYGKIYFDSGEIKSAKINDPNIFPVAAIFTFKKQFEAPTTNEGFNSVERVSFVRKQRNNYTNKALIVDYDGTLRETKKHSKYDYPTSIDDIQILPNREKILKEYIAKGYLVLGVSNQSGIAKGTLTEADAIKCFNHTNKLLSLDIPVYFCKHKIPPLTCYCRKPQSGLGIQMIEDYKLNPAECIMVGDMTTDKTFAKRLGFQYIDQEDFFK